MRKIIIVISLLISMQSFAQYEKADAVYHNLVKEYTLNDDGSWDFHLEKELEILSHFAFHRLYGETFIVYSPELQNLEINHAYTIMKDGKKVKTPENAFNEVLPRGAANAPAHSHLREMVVTHTGLEVGAVIHLAYTLKNSKDLYPAFMGKEMIGENSPVEEMIIRVKVPQGTELTHKTYNIRTAPEISNEKGMDIYSWKFINLKANAHEPYQSVEQQPVVLFSAAKDLHRVYDRFVNQDAFRYQAGSIVMNKVKELTSDAESDLQAMINIQKFILEEMDLFRVGLDEAAYKVRTPDQVFKSNGGTALEKSLLMAAMLRQANINANVVAVVPGKYYDREMGNLMVTEDFLVQVNPREYDQYYLSAEGHPAENLKYTLGGKQLLIMDAAIESLRTFSGESYENAAAVEYEMNWTPGEIVKGNLQAELNYHLNPYLKIRKDTAGAKALFSGISSGEFTSFEVQKATDKSSSIEAAFEKKDPFKEQSGYYFSQLPEVSDKMPDSYFSKLPSERTTAMLLPFPVELTYSYTLKIPENFQGVLPGDISLKNEAGSVEISFRQKGSEILIKRKLKLTVNMIQPQDYPAFRQLITNWYDEKYRQIVLEKIPEK